MRTSIHIFYTLYQVIVAHTCGTPVCIGRGGVQVKCRDMIRCHGIFGLRQSHRAKHGQLVCCWVPTESSCWSEATNSWYACTKSACIQDLTIIRHVNSAGKESDGRENHSLKPQQTRGVRWMSEPKPLDW